jgi:predicted double-glycine peptidase
VKTVSPKKRWSACIALAALAAVAGLPAASSRLLGRPDLVKRVRAWSAGATLVAADAAVMQTRRNDCGPAALKMVLDAHGIERPLPALSAEAGLTGRGTSLGPPRAGGPRGGAARPPGGGGARRGGGGAGPRGPGPPPGGRGGGAGRRGGSRPRGRGGGPAAGSGLPGRSWVLAPEDLADVPLPAIAYVRRSHFVVIRRFAAPQVLEVDDPALGRLRWPVHAFRRIWSGETLIFDPAWAPAPHRGAETMKTVHVRPDGLMKGKNP